MGDIDIHPPGVNDIAQSVQALAKQASGNAGHCADESVSAAQANPGWANSPALIDCAQAWAGQLKGMVTEIGQLAERLATTAADYTRVDAECSALFERILDEAALNSWSAG